MFLIACNPDLLENKASPYKGTLHRMDTGRWYYATRQCAPTVFRDIFDAEKAILEIKDQMPNSDLQIVTMDVLQDKLFSWQADKVVGKDIHHNKKKHGQDKPIIKRGDSID